MSVVNIVDRRKKEYDVKCDAVFEPAWHDNSIDGATQFEIDNSFQVDELEKTTVNLAIKYAEKWDCPVTLHIYEYGASPTQTSSDKFSG